MLRLVLGTLTVLVRRTLDSNSDRVGVTAIMSSSYVAAATARAADATPRGDDELLRLISPRVVYDSGAWATVQYAEAGRCLVAHRAIAAGTTVFTELPLVVAYPEDDQQSLIDAVAGELRDLECWRFTEDGPQPVGDFAAACALQSNKGARGSMAWARSLAETNAHGAGGTLVDPEHERRGVLGVLCSMMAHECRPSCVIRIGAAADGSLIGLHTLRDVRAGELLSISYIRAYQCTAQRRKHLEAQHGFVCTCERCTALPELVRAFWCPACGDGPCSPASPSPACRELCCDSCARRVSVDDAVWARLESAEHGDGEDDEDEDEGEGEGEEEDEDEEEEEEEDSTSTAPVLHPYHHRPAVARQRRLSALDPAARVAALEQHAAARARLYATCTAAGLTHPAVAADWENVGVARLAAGDVDGAATAFAAAARAFGAFYGAESADATRCERGSRVRSLAEYTLLWQQCT